MKILILVPVLTILLVVIWLAWAGQPWSLSEKRVFPVVTEIDTDSWEVPEEHPSVIKILTWNVGFLFGEGSEGPGYEHRDQEFYAGKMAQMIAEIEGWDPDVIFLQEIDFSSSRSHGINQAQLLAREAGFPYVAEAVSWESNYIPFPYWPMRNNFGRVKSGGAILSRYPLSDHEVVLFAKPASNPWWYNIFYLHRYLQRVKVHVGDKSFDLGNLHLEAFDKADRQGQIRRIQQEHRERPFDVVAGDFNMLPASATKRSKFRKGLDDYENDRSSDLMRESGLAEVIPDEIYRQNEARYFTFPAGRPDRRLDYVFYNSELKMMKAEVLTSTVSDHLPIRASFQIDSPRINPYSQ